MTLLDLRDAIAKAIADSIGHGMREKCQRHADAVLKVVAPQLMATAEHARREYTEMIATIHGGDLLRSALLALNSEDGISATSQRNKFCRLVAESVAGCAK
jgi:hypothetical protein